MQRENGALWLIPDGSGCGTAQQWTAVAVQPSVEVHWFEIGIGRSIQWAVLWMVWLPVIHAEGSLHVYAGSGAIFRGLMLWMLSWTAQDYQTWHCALWSAKLWRDL